MGYGKLQESEIVETPVAFSSASAKTRKNNISKRQRIECFQAALGDFWRDSKKYLPAKKEDWVPNKTLAIN